MDIMWTLGVLAAGAENVVALACGSEPTRAEAIEAASGALVLAATDHGRQEYRLTVADTRIIIIPGLTDRHEVDLFDLRCALHEISTCRRGHDGVAA